MSTNENTPLPDNGPATPAVSVHRSALMGPQEPAWVGVPEFAAAEPQVPSISASAYFHGLRRHWVLAISLGLLCAVLAAAGIWFGWGPQYTVAALFQIETSQPMVVFKTVETPAERFIQSAFDIYKDDQALYVKSTQVVTKALGDREVAGLSILEGEEDPVKWIQDNLAVTFPRDSGVMQVSLTDNDGKKGEEVAKLVNAVVDAYVSQIVDKEKERRIDRLNELVLIHNVKRDEVQTQMENRTKLASDVGTADPDALRLRQQMAMQRFGDTQRRASQAWAHLERARADLKGQQTLLTNLATVRIPQVDIDAYTNSNPMLRQLTDELSIRIMARDQNLANARPGSGTRQIERYEYDVNVLEAQIKALGGDAAEIIREKMSFDFETEISRLEVEIQVQAELERQLKDEMSQQEKQIKQLSNTSIDLEMARARIDRLNSVLATIDDERGKLEVEVGSKPRVQLIQRAMAPKTESRWYIRLSLTLLTAAAGLCLPIACITWWDTRGQRINSATDVSQGLGLTVLGSVPTIPARAIRQLGSSSKRHQTWHLRLTESIDGIAARLLRQAEVDQTRVILISSATSGEGKTTLATQLAMSLARSGRRTVLVDFDLRRPAFDKVLGLPLEPGVSEVLRGQADTSEVVHETGTDKLYVTTAGRWDRQALTALANGAAGRLFEAFREQYEFVVVDAAPILPVADTRFISQHVDTVVLSIFRDISRAPKITAACEILKAFGVGCVEAVVTGPTDHLPDRDLKYEATIPAVQTAEETTASSVVTVDGEEISNDGKGNAV